MSENAMNNSRERVGKLFFEVYKKKTSNGRDDCRQMEFKLTSDMSLGIIVSANVQ